MPNQRLGLLVVPLRRAVLVNRAKGRPVIVGYARTSTAEQRAGLDAQMRNLTAAGAEQIFSEQVSSVAQRPKLAKCLGFLRESDTLRVTRPDRLARSTHELPKIAENWPRPADW
jgi:DNA invertase Pin-like site-specific DNA recombinase